MNAGSGGDDDDDDVKLGSVHSDADSIECRQ